MFCPNCGKELPADAMFCPNCGQSVSEKSKQPRQQELSEVLIPDQSSEKIIQGLYSVEGNMQQQPVFFKQKKSTHSKTIIGIVIAVVVAVVSIFLIRAYNENGIIQQIHYDVCDNSSDSIYAYYKDYLGEHISVSCESKDFSAERGSLSNSFGFTGKIRVTDTSDISQNIFPTYIVYITGTVTTDFFRTEHSLSYTLQYQVPEDKNVISMQTLYQAYSSNAASANNTYANQYLNVSGTITDIRSNTYLNTVDVVLGLPSAGIAGFYVTFEFDSTNEDVYDLKVGEKT